MIRNMNSASFGIYNQLRTLSKSTNKFKILFLRTLVTRDITNVLNLLTKTIIIRKSNLRLDDTQTDYFVQRSGDQNNRKINISTILLVTRIVKECVSIVYFWWPEVDMTYTLSQYSGHQKRTFHRVAVNILVTNHINDTTMLRMI